MVQVLFVCLGNIAVLNGRSDFSRSCRKEGLEEKIVIDSAGTGDWHVGHPPHKGTQKF